MESQETKTMAQPSNQNQPGAEQELDPLAVANWFVVKANKDQRVLTHMKLQKLLYFAQGWWLKLVGPPLMSGEFEAWEHGPVHPEVYWSFKARGNSHLDALGQKIEGGAFVTPQLEPDDSLNVFLERIWEVYGSYSVSQLRASTHTKGNAWDQVYHAGERSAVIPRELMKEEFIGRGA